MTISPLSHNQEASKQLWLKGLSSHTQEGTERTKVKVMGGPSLSSVLLKHKILYWVEEIMKLEENAENGNPPTWKALLRIFKLITVGNSSRWGNIFAGMGQQNCEL